MMRIERFRLGAAALAAAAALGASACDGDAAGPNLAAEYVQVERMGLPAIATVFIPTAQKDAYNQAAPADDPATNTDEVVAVLTAFGHPTPAALADALLPDILPIDVSQPTAFLNGRAPVDDVITAELGLIFGSNADLNDDHVDGNDKAFLPAFPYLAAP